MRQYRRSIATFEDDSAHYFTEIVNVKCFQCADIDGMSTKYGRDKIKKYTVSLEQKI